MAVEALIGLTPKEISLERLNGDAVSLTGNVLSCDYFENILEPAVTMKIAVNAPYNLISELPIRGGERVKIELELASGTFKKEMFVYKAAGADFQKQSGVFTLHLTSEYGLANDTVRCFKRYSEKSTIDKHIKNILKKELNVDSDRINEIEETSNRYGFFGNNRKPFQICQWLCPKGISNDGPSGVSGKDGTPKGKSKGTAGFFFYENSDGFNFRSIDSLVSGLKIQKGSSDSEELITFFSRGFGGIDANKLENNFHIINHNYERNVDLRKAFGIGMYNNDTYFYNTKSHYVSRYNYNLKEQIKDSHLGKSNVDGAPDIFQTQSTRTIVRTSDHGVMGVSGELEDSGRDEGDMAKSFSRYNLMFTQSLNILVPCNLNLKVGDVIKCELPALKEGKSDKIDEELSGRYLIKEVRHHFEVGENTSSLKLIRDSYGFS